MMSFSVILFCVKLRIVSFASAPRFPRGAARENNKGIDMLYIYYKCLRIGGVRSVGQNLSGRVAGPGRG